MSKLQFEEGVTFFQGEDPDALAEKVEQVLNDVLDKQLRMVAMVGKLAAGRPWEEARRADDGTVLPLVYTRAFRKLLVDEQKYDEKVLDDGNFVAVREASIAESDIEPEILIRKREVGRWLSIFDKMARRENWSAERIQGILAEYIGAYAGEPSSDTPLDEVLTKRAGLPLRNTTLLRITPEEIRQLEERSERERIAYYGRLFDQFRIILEGIERGELYRIGTVIGVDGRPTIVRGKKPEKKDIWSGELVPGAEAAYIESRYLP
uniref:Uncharacterized protein n=1 Tax=Candidatus Kentrum sp. FM TaxID=2126340 RepID=A0A450W0V1_9GAMM|nr:MAG: hypothetical protein BECKFM1743A_GA0114220_101434 [Candidatus Kentron sp. FM]VFJ55595.1 MAG: hypothetical protein BECKFM1743C_GA0114222_101604 [Candidatus Kentron sp. FM]VFK10649.1 MAG: hypothetical protein BECKFM1743B_GA0114221_101484 [Candidatus Kentron sp. FM]